MLIVRKKRPSQKYGCKKSPQSKLNMFQESIKNLTKSIKKHPNPSQNELKINEKSLKIVNKRKKRAKRDFGGILVPFLTIFSPSGKMKWLPWGAQINQKLKKMGIKN